MVDAGLKNAAYYKAMFFVEDEDIAVLQSAGAVVFEEQARFYVQFYAWLAQHSFFKSSYTEEVMKALEENEDIFWADALQADIDDDFVDRQNFFGYIFAQVGIPYDAYIALLSYYQQLLGQLYAEKGVESLELLKAVKKISALTVAIITDGYHSAAAAKIQEQNDALKAMSTPITQLWEGILLLPLVGFIDSGRAYSLMSDVLQNISAKSAKVFILDIAGIAAMDTAVANHLIKITKASKLMGCICYLSGISGAVAQTLVELGVALDDVQTSGTMLEALRKALGLTGHQIVRI
jgi:rsbT co-antagonist protein RsbR